MEKRDIFCILATLRERPFSPLSAMGKRRRPGPFPSVFLRQKALLQILQGLFLNAGYITAADSQFFGDLPLGEGSIAPQPIAQGDDNALAGGQNFVDILVQLLGFQTAVHQVDDVAVIGQRIHQRQRVSAAVGLDGLIQRDILRALFSGPENHQNFVRYPLGLALDFPLPNRYSQSPIPYRQTAPHGRFSRPK